MDLNFYISSSCSKYSKTAIVKDDISILSKLYSKKIKLLFIL